MRSYSLDEMGDLIKEGFSQAEQEIFRSLRNASTEERIAFLSTLDALNVVHKQLNILLDLEETSNHGR